MKHFVIGVLTGSLLGVVVAKGSKGCKNMIKKAVEKI